MLELPGQTGHRGEGQRGPYSARSWICYLPTQKHDLLKRVKPSEKVHKNSSKHTSESFQALGVTLRSHRTYLKHQCQAMEKTYLPKPNA